MAAASHYKQFLRLLEAWPVDKSKAGRDLGELIHKRVSTFMPLLFVRALNAMCKN